MRQRSEFLGLLAVGALALARPAAAIDFLATNVYALASNDTLRTELWVGATAITIAGTAEDDLFLLAQGATSASGTAATAGLRLPGTLRNDVWGLADNISLSGTVGDHARLIGIKTLAVDGTVGRSLLGLGNAVRLGPTSAIRGNVRLFAREIVADGQVGGDAVFHGGTVTLGGAFAGAVHITADNIVVMPGTRIGGDLVYRMGKDLVLDEKVQLGGLLKRAPAPLASPAQAGQMQLLVQLAFATGALLVGLLYVALFPAAATAAVAKLEESFWRSLLFGFIAFCLVPLAAFVFLITLVGIPLGVMLVLAYGLTVYLGKIVVALALARRLLRRQSATPPVLLLLVVGILLVYAGGGLPFPLGLLVWLTATWAGLGAIVQAMLDRRTPFLVACQQPAPTPPPLPKDERAEP
jgi:cytoskeletal protein CcmA (bactofilin family)